MLLTAILFFIAVIATLVFAIMRTYLMVASDYLLARNPNTSVSEIMRTSPHHHEGQPHEFLPAGIIFHRLESADCRA